jgi:hypothetical protein
MEGEGEESERGDEKRAEKKKGGDRRGLNEAL